MNKRFWILAAFLLAAGCAVGLLWKQGAAAASGEYIKYVEFDVPEAALERAMDADIQSEGETDWVDVLACLACQYGGEWSRYKSSDLDKQVQALAAGKNPEDNRYFAYYRQAYGAILDGLLGDFTEQTADEQGDTVWNIKYGLRAYLPVAYGYGYSDSDDFGVARSYGYKRRHLGHDMMGLTGTPIIAVESGTVAMLGWNQYGGWRIGIRTDDGKRYWYYAHLRQDRPFAAQLKEGQHVTAGEVIGYMGRTGYSAKENVSNIQTPHLHIGLELIFDESQFESDNEIWVNLYPLMCLLQKHRSQVVRGEDGEYTRRFEILEATP